MKKGIILLCIGLALISCKQKDLLGPIPELPVISSFAANPDEIDFGTSTTLSWLVYDATTVSIDQGIGIVSTSGSREVNPQVTTSYRLTATNSDGTEYATCTVTVNAAAIIVLDGNLVRSMTSYDCPQFEGFVKNTGNATGWNCMVTITCYSDLAKTTIIDTAHGFPADLGDIPVGVRAYFRAVAFDCDSHNEIPAIDVKIEWLNRDSIINQLLFNKITDLYYKTQERMIEKR